MASRIREAAPPRAYAPSQTFPLLTGRMSVCDSSGSILISLERLRALEAFEEEMKRSVDLLEILHERDKANPEVVAKRAMKYYEKHRDTIKARKREKRKLAKESVDS